MYEIELVIWRCTLHAAPGGIGCYIEYRLARCYVYASHALTLTKKFVENYSIWFHDLEKPIGRQVYTNLTTGSIGNCRYHFVNFLLLWQLKVWLYKIKWIVPSNWFLVLFLGILNISKYGVGMLHISITNLQLAREKIMLALQDNFYPDHMSGYNIFFTRKRKYLLVKSVLYILRGVKKKKLPSTSRGESDHKTV